MLDFAGQCSGRAVPRSTLLLGCIDSCAGTVQRQHRGKK